MRTAAVILAAGASTRLGEPKQLIKIDREELLTRTVRFAQLAGIQDVAVVLGSHIEEFRAFVRNAQVLENVDWEQGMSTSIRLGVDAAIKAAADAVLLLTCDQPAVTVEHIKKLIAASKEGKYIAASTYAQRIAVPALFPYEYFSELLLVNGDSGARDLLQAHGKNVMRVPLANGELDLDTPESLEAIRRIWSK